MDRQKPQGDRALPYAVNLRRLFAWHSQSNKDVARLLECAEHSVSGWVNGVRLPGGKYLMRIGALYGVNLNALDGDPDAFGLSIADPERFHAAEQKIAAARRA